MVKWPMARAPIAQRLPPGETLMTNRRRPLATTGPENWTNAVDQKSGGRHHVWRRIVTAATNFQRSRLASFLVNFLRTTSVHGMSHLVRSGLILLERLIWLAFIVLAIVSTWSLSERTWTRFQESPVVVTMDRNMLFWNTSFPSLTICPHRRIDPDKLEMYIANNSLRFSDNNNTSTASTANDFRQFVQLLANTSYSTIHNLPMTSTYDLNANEWIDLLYSLMWDFNPSISSGTSLKLTMLDTITEQGICYAINSKVAAYNTYTYWQTDSWEMAAPYDTVYIHPLDGEIYAQIINLSTSYEVYFHGVSEVADIAKHKYIFSDSDYTTVDLLALEILTSNEVKDLKISQRKCRFPYEADILESSPVYSFALCRMECRRRMAIQLCQCVPHFYRATNKDGQRFAVCDFKGLTCLARMKDDLITLTGTWISANPCDCPPNCDDSTFFVQSARSQFWFLGANFQWGINTYPKMQLKRDMIFGFTDVLVSIGGTAGLFLGCSLLSFTEFIYFLTWRLAMHLHTGRTQIVELP